MTRLFRGRLRRIHNMTGQIELALTLTTSVQQPQSQDQRESDHTTDVNAERAIVALALDGNPAILQRIHTDITDTDITDAPLRFALQTTRRMVANGDAPHWTMFAAWLREHPPAERVPLIAVQHPDSWPHDLGAFPPPAATLPTWVHAIHAATIRRAIVAGAHELLRISRTDATTNDITEAVTRLLQIGARHPGNPAERTEWEAKALLAEQFPEQKWVVMELITTGLAVLSGAPKQGKSWMALRLGVNVATGTPFMERDTSKGRVLYLALEDGARRAQKRLRMMPEHTQLDEGLLEIHTAAPTIDHGLITKLDQWRLKDSPWPPRLIVIDIFQRVRSAGTGTDKYADDYAAAAGLQSWANQHGLAVLVLHHNRKPIAGDDDPFTAVSGSTGLTGSVDLVMVLRGSRGSPEAALFMQGRDIEQREVSLRLTSGGLWEPGSMPVEMVTLPTRMRWDRDVWRFLEGTGPVPTAVLAKQFGLSEDAISKRLRRIEELGWISADGAKPSPGVPVFWRALTEQDIHGAPPLPPMAYVASVADVADVDTEAQEALYAP
jgi:hypothetical protein